MKISNVLSTALPIQIQRENKPSAPSRLSFIFDKLKNLQHSAAEALFPSSLLPQDPDLKMKRLANGLTYYVRKNAYPFPAKVSFHLIVKAGMRNEKEAERGIAHLIEHITAIETKHFKKNEILNYLNSKGVKWGRDNGAYTTDEKTVYKLDLSSPAPEELEKALFILSEVAGEATLSAQTIEHEREIVIDELKLRQNPLLGYQWAKLRILCEGTPYASLLDRKKEIESVRTCPAETVRDFYKRWYDPENMALIAVGDFDPEQTINLIEKHFAKIPASKNPSRDVDIQLKREGGTQILCVSHPEISSSLVEIHHQLPEVKHRGVIEKKEIEKELGNVLFTRILNQRLSDLAEEENAPFVRASSAFGKTIPNWQSFRLIAQAKEGQIPLALRHLLLEIKRLKTFGFTQIEFERAKKALLARFDSLILEKGKTESSEYIQEYHAHFMHNRPVPDLDDYVQLQRKILEGIDIQYVNSLKSSLLPKENVLISTASPKKRGVQPVTPEDIKKEIAYVAKEHPPRISENAVNGALLENLPAPVKIASIREHKKINVTEYTLKNGHRVFVKPTTFENDSVSIRTFSLRGIRDASVKDLSSARFASDFFDHCGLGKFDYKDLNKLLSTKMIGVKTTIEPYITSIKAVSSVQAFETALQGIHLIFTQPRYDRAAFERALKKKGEDLLNASNHPDVRFLREWALIIGQNHPEMKPFEYGDLKKVDYETCKNLHRNLYSNPADFTTLIVGNVQGQKTKELIERYLATIPGFGKKSPRHHYSPIPFPKGIIHKDVSVGTQTGSLSFITFPAPIQDTFKERCMSAWCCALLQSRLEKVLRLEMGKTYDQECGFLHSEVRGLNPDNPSKVLLAITGDPSSLKPLELKAIEQIRDLETNGPTPDEVSNLKKERMKAYSNAKNTNNGWMEILYANCLWNPNQDDFEVMQDKELKSLTPAAAKEQFKKIFPLSNYVVLNKLPKSNFSPHK